MSSSASPDFSFHFKAGFMKRVNTFNAPQKSFFSFNSEATERIFIGPNRGSHWGQHALYRQDAAVTVVSLLGFCLGLSGMHDGVVITHKEAMSRTSAASRTKRQVLSTIWSRSLQLVVYIFWRGSRLAGDHFGKWFGIEMIVLLVYYDECLLL